MELSSLTIACPWREGLLDGGQVRRKKDRKKEKNKKRAKHTIDHRRKRATQAAALCPCSGKCAKGHVYFPATFDL